MDIQDLGCFLPRNYLKNVLEQVVENEGFSDWKCNIEEGSKKGDNYVGKLVKVHINGICKLTGNSKNLDLVFKFEHESPEARQFVRSEALFNKEIFFYNEIQPFYKSFLQMQNSETTISDLLVTCPKLFHSVSNDNGCVLVLEDMTSLGYKMLNRQKCVDEAHCKLVLTEFAKLHAMSFAIQDKMSLEFSYLISKIQKESLFGNDGMIPKSVLKYVKSTVKALSNRLSRETNVKLNYFADNYFEIMEKLVDGSSNAAPYAVICHGDCWTNNFLFKYAVNSTLPTSLCLIDFQIVRYASPILDIAYFIYGCTDGLLRRKHFKSLLAHYYDSLVKNITLLKSDPNKLYPWEKFQEQLKMFLKFGLGMAFLILNALLVDQDKAKDMEEIAKVKEEIEPNNAIAEYENELHQRIYEIVTELEEIDAL